MGAAKDNVLAAAGVLWVQLVPLQETVSQPFQLRLNRARHGNPNRYGEIVMLSADSDVRKPG